jgi:hypothetical protein
MTARRLISVVLGAAVALAASGCGQNHNHDRAAVRHTVGAMVVAKVNERDAAYCSLLTGGARAELVHSAQRDWAATRSGRIVAPPPDLPPRPRTCEQARAVFRFAPAAPEPLAHDPDLLSGLAEAKIAVDGDHATVSRFNGPFGGREMSLVRTRAGWRFARAP